MRKLKLIVDTNIFIKGLFFQSKYFHCKTVLDIIQNKNIELIFSQDTVGELFYMVRLLISTERISYNDGLVIMNGVSSIFYDSVIVNTKDTIAPSCKDVFDDMFLKCYIESNADYILTDDFKSEMNKMPNIKVLASIPFTQKVVKGEFSEYGITSPRN